MARLMVGREMAASLSARRAPPARASSLLEVRGLSRAGLRRRRGFRGSARARSWASPGWSAPGGPSCSRASSACGRSTGAVRVARRAGAFRYRARQPGGRHRLSERGPQGQGPAAAARTCATNLTLAALRRFCRGLLIDAAREDARRSTRRSVDFDIRLRDQPRAGRASSRGGNQQKLLLAKMMLLRAPRSSSSTSRRAASTSAPRQQIYRLHRARSPRKAGP